MRAISLTKHPYLIKSLHPTKNGKRKPEDFLKLREEIWWKCKKDHEWKARISSRIHMGAGCPYCSGRLVTDKNSLLLNCPSIAKEWNTEKNKPLKVED